MNNILLLSIIHSKNSDGDIAIMEQFFCVESSYVYYHKEWTTNYW
jgi:hypothetical protein